MLYDTKALKCEAALDSEYNKTESNRITTSNKEEQGVMEDNIITCTENLLEFVTPYKNKEVTVHLEFPEQQNEEAVSDFFGRLKEIYILQIKVQSGQEESSALQCTTTSEKEEDTNG